MFGGAGGKGFTFGTPTTSTQPASSGGGLFGTPATGTAAGGFSFGGAATTAATAAPTGFSLGTPASGATQGFSFGAASTATPAGGFGLAGAATGAGTQPTGFSLGGALGSTATATPTATTQAAAPAAGGFSFAAPTGQPTAAPASTAPVAGTGGFGFGQTAGVSAAPATTSHALLSSLLTTPKTSTTAAPTPATGFSLGGTAQTTSASTGFKLGTTPAATTAATGFSLGGGLKTGLAPATSQPTAATTAAGGFGFGTQGTATTTTTSSLGFGLAATTTTSAGFGLKPPTSTTAPSQTAQPSTQMNYRQLEEQINKWMTELEEQERLFLQQATQVNAWDRLLVDNGEKITSLNGDMERVKVDQNKLEQELEFIKSQQRELEELLVPMETSLDLVPSSGLQPHADLERENTYQLADNIDAQLKQMVQDLKEIIDHLNTSSSNQDTNDPILQITKILNAHMDSLQWIDSNTALLSRKVEEISKQMEGQRKDQERNFRLVYD